MVKPATNMRSYSFEEVLEAAKKYFGGDELVASTWINKYALKDRDGRIYDLTPDDMHDRLAAEFARIERDKYGQNYDEWFGRFRMAFDKFGRIVPQGSPMTAIGNPFQIMSASNCVVVESPHDSIEGIMRTACELAQLYKRRCGVGVDLSTLRPEGFHVNNAARQTTGPVSFGGLYSAVTRKIAQKGRRGALMMSMSVHHPDVVSFAMCKTDKNEVTGANISVRLTDEFLKALEEGRDYEQRWPCEGEPVFRRMVSAQKVWDVIIKQATLTADPGLMFWSRMVNRLPSHCYPGMKTLSTNPCMPAWATVLTPNGISMLGEVNVGDTIWSGSKWTKILNKWQSGVKDVYRYRTNAGVFYGTDNHRIVQDGKKVEVGQAKSIDIAKYTGDMSSDFDMIDVINGLVIGDGTYHKASDGIYLSVGEFDKKAYSELMPFVSRITKADNRTDEKWWINKDVLLFDNMDTLPNRTIPYYYVCGNPKLVRGFLRGLYSANGCVLVKHNRIGLKSTSKAMVEMVQQMLSSLGISSYITTNKPHNVKFENGIYECKTSYDINITTDRCRFRDLIGFIHDYKNEALNRICEVSSSGKKKISYEIISSEYISTEPVFDITVDADEHTFWSGGHLVSNCGEIPLPKDSCRLISINLTAYVRHPFTDAANFNLDAFEQDVGLALRLCDNLVDLEIELIDRIIAASESETEKKLWSDLRWSAENGRRVGLGTHGEADMLAMLKIKFDSQVALNLAELISTTYRNAAYKMSVDLAKQRGRFPLFDWDIEKDNEFILDLPEDLREDIRVFGRRNISLLTRAPTGTVSMVSKCGPFERFNISSSGEPVFRNVYKRRRKNNPDDPNARIDFVDEVGDTWMEFNVYHGNVLNWADTVVANGQFDSVEKALENLPSYFVTSDQIDWQFRVDMQGIWQKNMDHSISSTINLPVGTSEKTVSDIYMRAWKAGLKGVTVYVEGSKSGVLVSKDMDRNIEIKRQSAPKRPQSLPCELHRVSYKGKRWVVAVGMLGNEPYEMFATEEMGDISSSISKGSLVKKARGRYALETNDGSIYNIAVPEFSWVTRLISTSLRHGVPIDFLVEQLNKEGTVADINRVLARVLKKYIKNGKVRSSECCENEDCRSPNLIWEDGCVKCLDCGNSKCG